MWPLIVRSISGDSMIPTLKNGNIVIGLRWFNKLKIGNVIIFEHNGKEKIKRLSKIKKDQLFVIGDNKAKSTDSRDFGYINIETVKARVIWPKVKLK